jgi:thiol-disulfide isomerase/thioredoxin
LFGKIKYFARLLIFFAAQMLIQLLLSLALFSAPVQETAVPVYDYAGLEPYLTKDNDTTYVINFWATWCKPCVKELPYFDQLGEEYREKKVKILLVSLDFQEKAVSHVQPFLLKRQVKSEVVLLDDPDADSWIPKIDSSWSGAIPATLIYQGSHRSFYEKSFTYEALKNTLDTFMTK